MVSRAARGPSTRCVGNLGRQWDNAEGGRCHVIFLPGALGPRIGEFQAGNSSRTGSPFWKRKWNGNGAGVPSRRESLAEDLSRRPEGRPAPMDKKILVERASSGGFVPSL